MFCFKLNVQSEDEIGRLLVLNRQVQGQLHENIKFCVAEGRSGACFDVLHSGSSLFVLIPAVTI